MLVRLRVTGLWERREGQGKASWEERMSGKKRRKDELPRYGGEWWSPQHMHDVPLQEGHSPVLGCEREESQESCI